MIIKECTYPSSLNSDFKKKDFIDISDLIEVNSNDLITLNAFKKLDNSFPECNNTIIPLLGYYYFDPKNMHIAAYALVDKEHLTALYVYDEYRGHSLSKQIVTQAITELGAKYIKVYKDNLVALKVYRDLGFVNFAVNKSSYIMVHKINYKGEICSEKG